MALSTSCPKPKPRVKVPRKGPTARLRAKKARIGELAERAIKSLVRDRDKVCRWPGCDCAAVLTEWSTLEVAHLTAKGAGGDPKLLRTTRATMILLCRWRHQGPFGLHAGRAKVVPETRRGTDGLCGFWYEREKNMPWLLAGVTSPPQRASLAEMKEDDEEKDKVGS